MRPVASIRTAERATATAPAVAYAYAAIVASTAGAALVTVGVSALDRPWVFGYISEAGAASSAQHNLYRTGIALLAISIGLLAVVVGSPGRSAAPAVHAFPSAGAAGPRRGHRMSLDRAPLGTGRSGTRRPGARGSAWWPRWIPGAATLLAAGAVLGAISSRVSCSTGCPLPPYQPTTTQDVVHAVASVGAVGLATLAMLSIAVTYPPGGLRTVCRFGVAICLPPLVFLAAAIGIAGRGTVTGIAERASLLLVLAWVIAVAGTTVAAARTTGG